MLFIHSVLEVAYRFSDMADRNVLINTQMIHKNLPMTTERFNYNYNC